MTLWIILTAFAIMLASLSGVVVLWTSFGDWMENHLGLVTSFAAGVFLVVTAQLIRHTIHATTAAYALLWIGLGVLFIYTAFATVPLFHHHHENECDHEHDMDYQRILFSDGLHNIGDGLLLVASFQVSIAAGIAAGVAIFVHEIVQEVSEFFVLKSAGLSTTRSLAYNFAVSATILIGAGIGQLAIMSTPAIRIPLLGIAGGSFLVVVVHDLLPHSVRNAQSNQQKLHHIGWFLAGLAIMAVTLLTLAH